MNSNLLQLEKQIQDWANSYERNGYLHGSILVAKRGKILLEKGFGMANWEHQIPNGPTTKFRIGSITKGFTAMAIFQLHEQSRLNLDDPIDKYLAYYPNDHKITIYHCLTSSTGIPDFTGFPDFWFKTMRLPATLQEVIDSFKDKELEFVPGTEFRYSTSGYMLLTAIIEEVSGQTYAEYMKDHIFNPLGMHDTGCDDGRKMVPGLASGYSFWEAPIHAEFADLSFPLGGYGLYSTTQDLYKWSQAIRNSVLISKELTDKMFLPYHDSYASGWDVSEVLGRKCTSHFGDISGFSSDFLRFEEEELDIIFLSNMNVTPVMKLTREIAKVMFGEATILPEPLLPISIHFEEAVCGTYTGKNVDGQLEIAWKNDDLFVTVPKMYGAVYKFKLVPIQQEEGKITFMTEMIHETLVCYFSGDRVEQIEYIDYYGNCRCYTR